MSENVDVLLRQKLARERMYLEVFMQKGWIDVAKSAFKNLFRRAILRNLKKTIDKNMFDLDPELQGLIALAHAVFLNEDYANQVIVECMVEFGMVLKINEIPTNRKIIMFPFAEAV